MELIKGTQKVSKVAPGGIISSMPDNVVTNILDRLPLQDAVRTSILSRNWRFKWTMLSQLVFDYNFYKYLLKVEGRVTYERIINRLLLHLKGVIRKFVLHTDVGRRYLDDEDIDQWIFFLSRQGIKDLTICNDDGPLLNLPTHLFSCLELRHLKLDCYCFDPPASFRGFPNLLSLELRNVQFESGEVVKFFSQCPALTNLKILTHSLYNLYDKLVIKSSIIFDLLGVLPKLQELYLEFLCCEFLEDGAKKRSPTTFPCLKTLKLLAIDLENGIMLSCAFEMIKSFPNLQTLEITPNYYRDEKAAICSLDVDYNTLGMLQLRSVVFTYIKASESEVCLIKYLLACSPFLKKIVIRPHSCLALGEQMMFAKKLLKLHRASPDVDINLC
ncbi:putative F-box domain, leucine-rich repeat domain superfamily, F-box-like domain superfamily [Helianthus annuus]|uniref:F-box domain, leucine-rich repeat domain superfamily, F-box-like domain superfamily n=1 Tax=Helianthus annuus TaxID=4232 RepID=A0A9K3H005_HELAN|nr:F-box/FBD/LRR-repeat protein At1g13570-like isoform X1 [Helianthus annuus]XP_022020388.1 F-box/FBD/LRR-repeat protein At1g13570-like isoform X1 [Helianthus annuus]KAF5762070.1 putative F-box domain, leucine-rich repeat domain superfamily, F-box-like domain superfamily [Helianthus annuus]KAJ0683237.1 putative F-box domain, leucine-rich repeat domain superfamily, F-box-like domain superfamily [Helianthus annuus]